LNLFKRRVARSRPAAGLPRSGRRLLPGSGRPSDHENRCETSIVTLPVRAPTSRPGTRRNDRPAHVRPAGPTRRGFVQQQRNGIWRIIARATVIAATPAGEVDPSSYVFRRQVVDDRLRVRAGRPPQPRRFRRKVTEAAAAAGDELHPDIVLERRRNPGAGAAGPRGRGTRRRPGSGPRSAGRTGSAASPRWTCGRRCRRGSPRSPRRGCASSRRHQCPGSGTRPRAARCLRTARRTGSGRRRIADLARQRDA